MGITIYNINKELYDGDNNYYIGRPSILSNPYTHIKDKHTLAKYVVNSRDEAIDMYEKYFDIMYNSNIEFTTMVDEIYEKYKNGEDVYLGCYCKPLRCHGDVIKDKLQQKLIKEKIKQKLWKKI